jgi:hypothetical protein
MQLALWAVAQVRRLGRAEVNGDSGGEPRVMVSGLSFLLSHSDRVLVLQGG